MITSHDMTPPPPPGTCAVGRLFLPAAADDEADADADDDDADAEDARSFHASRSCRQRADVCVAWQCSIHFGQVGAGWSQTKQ
jgi:hypothetical protein